ncbi:hypothetical protein [Streptomyces sp. WMMB303]|uniref:hypothetical protein n=1 Tax=Streptomyces sp. WMMB303 TaxID=3034154 RepID=UPI0023EE2767|nr:hypothetical protein [Streptomyces sp. WMMB303]MDF4251881.1 hypothetical protein [Streptomyces sp. WMMB303]
MPRVLRTLAAVLAVLVGSVGAGLTTPAEASASAASRGRAGYCPDADGVTVVVDFRELGGGTLVRCAPGGHRTGLAALKAAGIEVTGTNRWGESFVCRLLGKPGPQREPCVDTPPASAYWSYWHAPNGGRWAYSQRGVTYRTPPRGSFEGWSFSLDHTENDAPPPRVAPRRPSTGSGGGSGSGGAGPQQGGGGAVGGTGGRGGSSGAGGSDGSSSGPQDRGSHSTEGGKGETDEKNKGKDGKKPSKGSAEDDRRTEEARGSSGPVAAPTEAEDWQGGNAAGEDASGSSGVPVGTLAGGAAAAGLAAAGGVAAWRRRRSRGEDATTP